MQKIIDIVRENHVQNIKSLDDVHVLVLTEYVKQCLAEGINPVFYNDLYSDVMGDIIDYCVFFKIPFSVDYLSFDKLAMITLPTFCNNR